MGTASKTITFILSETYVEKELGNIGGTQHHSQRLQSTHDIGW